MLMTWPFPGPIMIEDKTGDGHEGEAFIIDRWSITRWIAYDECGTKELLSGEPAFDYDHYRIIVAYVKDHRMGRVKQLRKEEVDQFIARYDLSSSHLEDID